MAQIGTVKVQTPSGPVELPVFDTADACSGVYDMVRVDTPSGVGFIPFASTADAAYPYVRLQTQNQGTLAAHNAASTVTVTEIDYFEDGNMSEYINNGNFSADTGGQVLQGSYSLTATGGGTGNFTTSNSGLNAYPSQGDTFHYYYYNPSSTAGSGWQGGIIYGNNDTSWSSNDYPASCYHIRVNYNDGEVQITRDNGGSFVKMAIEPASLPQDEWVEVEVEWTTGDDHNVTLRDSADNTIVTLTTNDGTYTSGGVGWFHDNLATDSGMTAYFDQAEITS